MRRLPAITLPLVLAGTLAGITSAQEPAPDIPPPLGEQVNVNLLQIPLIAVDSKNQPITDLRFDEIEIKVGGRKVEVSFLEPFIKPSAVYGDLPDVRLSLNLPGGSDSVTSNKGAAIRNILFFIDVENDQPLGKTLAASQLIRYVMEDMEDGTSAAVLSYNGHINIETTFTTDRHTIANAVRAAFEQPPRPNIDLSLRIRQLIDRVEDCVIQRREFISKGYDPCLKAVGLEYADEVRPRAVDFLEALDGVIAFASGLEGRKSVFAVTHGVAMEPTAEVLEVMKAVLGDTADLSDMYIELVTGEGARIEMDRLMSKAIREDVTLHMIDRTTAPSGVTNARSQYAVKPGARPMEAAFLQARQDASEIARTTGGMAIADMDLHDAVLEATNAEKGAYYAGCYLDLYLPRDKRSKVSVKTSRKGVTIRHSLGTFAEDLRPGAQDVIRARIGFAQPQKVAGTRDGVRVRVPFQISADPQDLGYQRVDEAAIASFTLHVQVLTDDGRVAADTYHLVSHGYPWANWLDKDIEPVLIEGWVEVPEGEFQMSATFANPLIDFKATVSRELNIASRNPVSESPEGTDSPESTVSPERTVSPGATAPNRDEP